jgi:hypothetical protein
MFEGAVRCEDFVFWLTELHHFYGNKVIVCGITFLPTTRRQRTSRTRIPTGSRSNIALDISRSRWLLRIAVLLKTKRSWKEQGKTQRR